MATATGVGNAPAADVIGQAGDFLGGFGLEGVLITITLGVTLVSYRSQKRAGLREAIEQIQPRQMDYRETTPTGTGGYSNFSSQLKSALEQYSFLQGRCTISIRATRIVGVQDRVVSHSIPPPYLTLLPQREVEDFRPLRERILDHEHIESVERNMDRISVSCATTNPVECRNAIIHVLDEFDVTGRSLLLRHDARPTHHRKNHIPIDDDS